VFDGQAERETMREGWRSGLETGHAEAAQRGDWRMYERRGNPPPEVPPDRRADVLQQRTEEAARAQAEGRPPREIPLETSQQAAAREASQRASAEDTARIMGQGFGAIARAEPEVHRRMMEGERKGLEAELAELAQNEKDAAAAAGPKGISELGRRAIERRRASITARLRALP
jgi:hypothetical protein